MDKKVIKKFGEKQYLLGVDKEGNCVWLKDASFDCGWYWGIGYVETFNLKDKDIISCEHFDNLFLKENIYNGFLEYFSDTTLSNSEIWRLLEIMKSLYTLREYSDMMHIGGSHITKNPIRDILKDESYYKKINDKLIPALLYELEKILSC